MPSLCKHSAVLCLLASCALPAFSATWPWKHHAPRAATKHSSPARPSEGADTLHAHAHFSYDGKTLGPFNAADPAVHDIVEAMNSGRNSVHEAERVCSAFVPGKEMTIGPDGSLDFDYVPRSSYVILLCTHVTFANSPPVWVSAVLPVSIDGFTLDRLAYYDLSDDLDVVLDPYAVELKAIPVS
jgi:hypothetical protein